MMAIKLYVLHINLLEAFTNSLTKAETIIDLLIYDEAHHYWSTKSKRL